MKQKRILIYDDSFREEFIEIVKSISVNLKNPGAAERLSRAVQKAILDRSQFPGTFEPFLPTKTLRFTYYRIYVGNYIIFYYFQNNEMHISHIFYYAADYARKLK